MRITPRSLPRTGCAWASSLVLANRHLIAAATTAAELHAFSAGRFVYGIGAGPPDHDASFYGFSGARPTRRMTECLNILRGAWAASAREPCWRPCSKGCSGWRDVVTDDMLETFAILPTTFERP